MKASHSIIATVMTVVFLSFSGPAYAQPGASGGIQQDVAAVAGACIDHWETPACLSAISAASLALASGYGTALQQGGHGADAENIKQHCAASTAATQGVYPVAAMKSAFTECANAINETATKTGVNPDPSQYQLLIGPLLCLSGDPRCADVTAGLRAFVQKK